MELTVAHWFYLIGTLVIIGTMLFKRNVVVPAIAATFVVALSHTGSMVDAFQSVFQASFTAATSLFDIFLIIAVMTALLNALSEIGADEKMIQPFRRVMTNGHISYVVLIVVTYAISVFFWPTPAVPIVGAILIPVAIRAGLPPIGAAVSIAIAGQGMALSADYIIQIAPTLSATAGDLSVSGVADKALILSVITGITALVLAYVFMRKSIKNPSTQHLEAWKEKEGTEEKAHKENKLPYKKSGKIFAWIIPVSFLFVVTYMIITKMGGSSNLDGGDGAALIGGVAFLLLIFTSIAGGWRASLEKVSEHMIDGLIFAFKAMGIVLPIAGFFFLGNDETAAQILGVGEDAPAFLFELILVAEQYIPANGFLAAFGMLIIGMITGLDGSGFSGLPLTGALSGPLGSTMGMNAETLAAVGQMGAIWVGGGTLIAWSSLVAVAGFTKVPVMELVRKCFIPVVAGLFLSTLFAIFFL